MPDQGQLHGSARWTKPLRGGSDQSQTTSLLEHAVRRIERHLARRGLLGTRDDDLDLSGDGDPECALAASACSGQSPPAGPQWSSGLRPLRLRALAYDKPLCASLDGFTLHAATRAGGLDAEGREALLRYVLRPPIAQERVEQRPDGLVRITLKKAYAEREACPRGMGRSRLTWIHSRSCAGSPPA